MLTVLQRKECIKLYNLVSDPGSNNQQSGSNNTSVLVLFCVFLLCLSLSQCLLSLSLPVCLLLELEIWCVINTACLEHVLSSFVFFFSFHNVKTSYIIHHHCSGKACWIFFLSFIHHTFKKTFHRCGRTTRERLLLLVQDTVLPFFVSRSAHNRNSSPASVKTAPFSSGNSPSNAPHYL